MKGWQRGANRNHAAKLSGVHLLDLLVLALRNFTSQTVGTSSAFTATACGQAGIRKGANDSLE